jgi:hypothetical protein
VYRDDDTIFTIRPSKEELYYYDFQLSIDREMMTSKKLQPQQQNTMVINTIEELKRNYTARELKQVEIARRLYVMMGRPSREDFNNMIKNGKILNNPVTTEDYKRAEAIYGTDLGVIKGKTTKKKSDQVQIELSQAVYERNIILAVDIMHFTGLNFLVTVSRTIKFITVMHLVNRKKKTIVEAMRQVINLYKGRGHTVTDFEFTETEDKPIHTILADNEFEVIRLEMEGCGIRVNLTAKNKHVPEVERQNRVIKERARSIIQTLPYRHVPKKIRIGLIQYATFWLNNIPKTDQQHSPRDLIFGEQKLDYNVLCQLPFGAYVLVHDDLEVTNTVQSRITGAINLGVTGNIQGTHRFFNLNTGEIIVRRKWTKLPISNEVINRLQDMTNTEVESGCEMYEYDEYNDEEEHQVEEERENTISGVQTESGIDDKIDDDGRNNDDTNDVNTVTEPEMEEENVEDEQPEEENNENNRYNLRSKRTRNHLHRFTFVSVKAGLNKWGDKARKALLDKLLMFLQLKVFAFISNPTKKTDTESIKSTLSLGGKERWTNKSSSHGRRKVPSEI